MLAIYCLTHADTRTHFNKLAHDVFDLWMNCLNITGCVSEGLKVLAKDAVADELNKGNINA